MASAKVCLLLLLVLFIFAKANAHVELGFYNDTCPNAESVVHSEMVRILKVAPTLAGPLLRLHFHDCFVQGCDASILLNARTKTEFVEKDAPPNRSLRGFNVIDGIKEKLEKACPGVVSCADIIALVAREAVYLTGGPFYEVPTGRRDGNRSVAFDILTALPPANATISMLKTSFLQNNLSVKDLVVLSGGHTIGTSHCTSFSERIYTPDGEMEIDKSLDNNYAYKLMSKCKPNDITTLVEMDPGSFLTFDTNYYKVVAKHRGLLGSDEALLNDPETYAYVQSQAKASPEQFFIDFAESMVKMGKIGVLPHEEGEIRKKCGFRN